MAEVRLSAARVIATASGEDCDFFAFLRAAHGIPKIRHRIDPLHLTP
jgi:hypothetical protein